MVQVKVITLVSLCGILAIFSLLVGTQLAYHFGQVRTTTTAQNLTFTTTTTSQYTEVQANPQLVRITGTVSTDNYAPQELQFENKLCGPLNIPPPNCIVNATIPSVSGSVSNGTADWSGGYSVNVPNNQNYGVYLVLDTENNTVYGSQEILLYAGYLPLNSSSVSISDFDIQCLSTGDNYTHSGIACQIVSNEL